MYKYGKVDIRALQVILGRVSVSTTEIYTHVDNESLHHAVEQNPLSAIRPRQSATSPPRFRSGRRGILRIRCFADINF